MEKMVLLSPVTYQYLKENCNELSSDVFDGKNEDVVKTWLEKNNEIQRSMKLINSTDPLKQINNEKNETKSKLLASTPNINTKIKPSTSAKNQQNDDHAEIKPVKKNKTKQKGNQNDSILNSTNYIDDGDIYSNNDEDTEENSESKSVNSLLDTSANSLAQKLYERRLNKSDRRPEKYEIHEYDDGEVVTHFHPYDAEENYSEEDVSIPHKSTLKKVKKNKNQSKRNSERMRSLRPRSLFKQQGKGRKNMQNMIKWECFK